MRKITLNKTQKEGMLWTECHMFLDGTLDSKLHDTRSYVHYNEKQLYLFKNNTMHFVPLAVISGMQD